MRVASKHGWLALWLIGCNPEVTFPSGTGVGNPGTTRMQTRKVGDIELFSATAVLGGVGVTRCPPDAPATIAVGRQIDLLGDGPFAVPGGNWCTLHVVFNGPLNIEGRGEEDDGRPLGTFDLTLDVPQVDIPIIGEVFVRGEPFIVELGHRKWSDIDGLDEDSHTVIGPADREHDEIAEGIARGSAVFHDADGDGVLDGDERNEPIGAGDDWIENEDDDD